MRYRMCGKVVSIKGARLHVYIVEEVRTPCAYNEMPDLTRTRKGDTILPCMGDRPSRPDVPQLGGTIVHKSGADHEPAPQER